MPSIQLFGFLKLKHFTVRLLLFDDIAFQLLHSLRKCSCCLLLTAQARQIFFLAKRGYYILQVVILFGFVHLSHPE